MVKIIFSDFDETLMDYHSEFKHISEYGINVLKKIKDKGIKFVIVTGRPINFFDRVPELLKLANYIISSNGAEIYDVRSNKLIYYNDIGVNIFKDIFNYCKDNGIEFLINSGIDRYNYGGKHNNSISINDSDINGNVNQIIFLPKGKDEFEELKYFLLGITGIKFGNIVYNEERCSIDINNVSVSKGSSIEYLCGLLDIEIEDTIGFGDSDNDLSMFEVVGKSICVRNSTDVIKQLVDEVIDDCDSDGVFKYLDNNIL